MDRKIRIGNKKQINKMFQILFTWSSYLPNDSMSVQEMALGFHFHSTQSYLSQFKFQRPQDFLFDFF